MLKSIYATLEEIAEADRQHYKKIGGRYVLELDGEHPVQAQVTTLIQEKKDEVQKISQRAATAEAEVATLKQAAANQPTLPSGHVPVPADEAKLLEAVKELGKPEEIKTKLEQLETLTTENTQMKRLEQLRQVAGGANLKLSVFQMLDEKAGGLAYEERDVTVDNKIQKAWHVKDSNKWVPLKEYSETHWKDFGPALSAEEPPTQGTRIPGQKPDDKGPKPDLYSRIRQQAEERQQKKQTESIPLEKRLNLVA